MYMFSYYNPNIMLNQPGSEFILVASVPFLLPCDFLLPCELSSGTVLKVGLSEILYLCLVSA